MSILKYIIVLKFDVYLEMFIFNCLSSELSILEGLEASPSFKQKLSRIIDLYVHLHIVVNDLIPLISELRAFYLQKIKMPLYLEK